MIDYIMFWLSAAVVKAGLVLSLFVFIMLLYFLVCLPNILKRLMCKHESYWENRACHGICNHCHKDLGFIGTLRENKHKKETR